MTYIRKLEMRGFKSSGPRPVVVNFEKGFTVVTGPNGSGKSNIGDAILFAIGENSPKALRAANGKLSGLIYDPHKDETTDVQKPKECRVTLQFDNSDRTIPVDSDSVTVTRELREDGENVYYLNGKKTTRGNLTELLDLAGLSPGGLNVVTQGASSGVAEMSLDEKRKMIEGVVGIAKFDERKAEALRTLSAADQKIEVAMARIGEQRAVLDSLDTQRNDMVRFNLVENQITWLNAVQTSKRIEDLKGRLSSLKAQELEANAKLAELNRRHADYEARVTEMENEKNKFIVDVIQGGGSAPTELSVRLQGVSAELDAFVAELQRAESDVRELEEEQVPTLKNNVSIKRGEARASEAAVSRLTNEVAKLEGKREELTQRLKVFFKASEELRRTNEKNVRQAAKAQVRLADLAEQQNDIERKISSTTYTLEENKKGRDERKTGLDEYTEMLTRFETKTKELMELHASSTNDLGAIEGDISEREEKRDQLIASIEAASRILEKATTEVSKEEAFRKISESIAGERVGQVKLQEACENGAVPGYVGRLGQLVKYPQTHTRAVQAVMGRWLGAFIVEDLRSMTHLIKAAKALGARAYSVIPLSEVAESSSISVPKSPGVIGALSRALKCDDEFIALVNFLAGDTVLVESEPVGYLMASEGVRAVTLGGDLFEPGGKAFTFGYQEVLINLMEGLENIEGASEIEDAVGALKNAISRRRSELQGLESESKSLLKERLRKLVDVTSLKAESASYNAMAARYRGIYRSMNLQYQEKAKRVEREESKLKIYTDRKDSLIRGVNALRGMIEESQSLGLDSMLAELDGEKKSVSDEIDTLRDQISDANLRLSVEKSNMENVVMMSLERNENDLRLALDDLSKLKPFTKDAPKKMKELSEEKKDLEAQIQKLVESSKNSQPVLDEYDTKVKRLKEERDSIGRSVAESQKELFSVANHLTSIQEKVEEAVGSLRILGYTEEPEVFEESDQLLAALQEEHKQVSSSVNKAADRQYRDMYVGYKNLSTRNNELEKERVSIIRFIESVESEKRKVFVGAFERINAEFKTIFNRLTGGEAWLELEKPDEIFTGGVRLLAKFGTKPPWESLSLSGGEKAVSGVSLILAMQGVQPQPFYLFDEIDSALDGVNSGNLATFLKERSLTAQIVAMSLRDVFVEQSSMTYGVYSAGGISRIVHYKPAEATVSVG
ncbi:MAG: chromosome segregation protein SMC [Nitrososphaerales archaeon]|nr:chromosome segregation protein SMC [Nitrososphaerales archaeon]